MKFTSDIIYIRNFNDEPEDEFDALKFSYHIDTSEFKFYDLKKDATLVVRTEDLLRMLNLAMAMESFDFTLKFLSCGLPMEIKMDDQTSVSLVMMLSTMKNSRMTKKEEKATYKQIMREKYIHEENTEDFIQASSEKVFTEWAEERAVNPKVSQYDSADIEMQSSPSKQNKASSSFIATIPTAASAPRKRKSTDVLIELVSNNDHDESAINISATLSEYSQKRQKFEMTSIEAALNESERNEVNDILSQIDDFMCDEEFDELPLTQIPSQNVGFTLSDLNKTQSTPIQSQNVGFTLSDINKTQFTSTTQNSSVANNYNLTERDKSRTILSTTLENSDVNTDASQITDAAESIHSAVFRNIGNIIRSKGSIQVQSINDPSTSSAGPSKSLNIPLRPSKLQIQEKSRFVQMFKTERLKKKFGKVIVEGSESDEEMVE